MIIYQVTEKLVYYDREPYPLFPRQWQIFIVILLAFMALQQIRTLPVLA